MSQLLDRETLLALLGELGSRLNRRGVTVELYVVGGTAMTLAYDRDRLTRDIDATWEDSREVAEVVEEMAQERGLPRDWLNDRVRPMLPRVVDADQVEALVIPGIRVAVASPRHMIAMKARAARDARDLEDLMLLCRHEGISSVEDVMAIADSVWGPGMLREDTLFTLRTGLTERGLAP